MHVPNKKEKKIIAYTYLIWWAWTSNTTLNHSSSCELKGKGTPYIKNLPHLYTHTHTHVYGDYCLCIFDLSMVSLASAWRFFSIFPKQKIPNTHNLENFQASKWKENDQRSQAYICHMDNDDWEIFFNKNKGNLGLHGFNPICFLLLYILVK